MLLAVVATFLYRDPYFGVFFFIGCLSYLSVDEWLGMRGTVARLWSGVAGNAAIAVENKPVLGARS